MENEKHIMELTEEEMVQFLNCLGEDTIVNVTIEEKGGDTDGRREAV